MDVFFPGDLNSTPDVDSATAGDLIGELPGRDCTSKTISSANGKSNDSNSDGGEPEGESDKASENCKDSPTEMSAKQMLADSNPPENADSVDLNCNGNHSSSENAVIM